MKCYKDSLSIDQEKKRQAKNSRLIEKSEKKLNELGFTLVTRNTHWIVYDNLGGRYLFEDSESLYKFCYRKKYQHAKDEKKPIFVIKKSGAS
ncbi:MAG: hypothetical protein CMK44_04745 [Porticoccus sp.]|jgi:hypothetical protein|nr:hypothetical protein [Porticoccus sp.]|tara:strand:+ start:214 stop:489 length:276 start_codon:yes stop_codon:yes gene_type:complete